MPFVLGAGLVGLTVLMLILARPTDGEPAAFLRSWVVGQAYALVAMISSVSGGALMIFNWPF
jgi:hypothetical protein